MSHTPAPWTIHDEGSYISILVEKVPRTIAAVMDRKDGSGQANARLIAAAPELLEALKALYEQFTAYRSEWLGPGHWRDRVGLLEDMKRAYAALRKADGQ